MTDAIDRRPLLDVLEEHLEELAFLLGQRPAHLFAEDWGLADLLAHDERIEAHLDALLVASRDGLELAEAGYSGDDEFLARGAALVIACADPAGRARVVRDLGEGDEALLDARRGALRHAPLGSEDFAALETIAASESRAVATAAIDLLAFHRAGAPPSLARVIDRPCPGDALVVAAAGRLGGPWSPDALESCLASGDASLERAALETSARLALPRLRDRCLFEATRAEEPQVAPVAFLGVVGTPDDAGVLSDALAEPELATAAIDALGGLGRPETLPRLLELLGEGAHAVAAARALARITGETELLVEEPDPTDEDAEPPAPDEELAAEAIARLRGSATDGARYQCGLEITDEGLVDRLPSLSLAARRDAFLRLRAAEAACPDVELEAFARRQGAQDS